MESDIQCLGFSQLTPDYSQELAKASSDMLEG